MAERLALGPLSTWRLLASPAANVYNNGTEEADLEEWEHAGAIAHGCLANQ